MTITMIGMMRIEFGCWWEEEEAKYEIRKLYRYASDERFLFS